MGVTPGGSALALDLADLTAIAQGADPAVTGCAVLRPDREPEPGWVVVVALADGSRVRIDGAGAESPAVTALTAADLSPVAVAARAAARTRAEALTTLNTRADLTAVQVRALIEAIVFLVNNRLESLGQPRVLAPEIFAYLAANPTAGDPAGVGPATP